MIKFLPTLPKKILYEYRIEYHIPVYEYLSESAFLANLTPPNKQFLKEKLESKSRGHECNS